MACAPSHGICVAKGWQRRSWLLVKGVLERAVGQTVCQLAPKLMARLTPPLVMAGGESPTCAADVQANLHPSLVVATHRCARRDCRVSFVGNALLGSPNAVCTLFGVRGAGIAPCKSKWRGILAGAGVALNRCACVLDKAACAAQCEAETILKQVRELRLRKVVVGASARVGLRVRQDTPRKS